MPMTNKEEALEFFVLFTQIIFPPDVCDRVQNTHSDMVEQNLTEAYAVQLSEKVDNTIRELLKLLHKPMEMKDFAKSLDDEVLVFLLLRCTMFENYLNSLKPGHKIDLNLDESLLRFGLIERWEDAQKFGPYFRHN